MGSTEAFTLIATSTHSFSSLGWGADALRAVFTVLILKTIEKLISKVLTYQRRGTISFTSAVVSEALGRAWSIPGLVSALKDQPILDIKQGVKLKAEHNVNKSRILISVVSFLLLVLASEVAVLVGSYTVATPVRSNDISLAYVARTDSIQEAIPPHLGCKWFRTVGQYFTSTMSTGLCITDDSGDSRSLALASNTGSIFFKFTSLPSGIKLDLKLSPSSDAIPTNTTATLTAVTVSQDRGVLRTHMVSGAAAVVMRNWIESVECLGSYTGRALGDIDPENPPEWVGCTSSAIEKKVATAGEALRRAASLFELTDEEGISPWEGGLESNSGPTSAIVGFEDRPRMDSYLLLGLAVASIVLLASAHMLPTYDPTKMRVALSSIALGTSCSAALREIPPDDVMEIIPSHRLEDQTKAHIGLDIPEGYVRGEISKGAVVAHHRAMVKT